MEDLTVGQLIERVKGGFKQTFITVCITLIAVGAIGVLVFTNTGSTSADDTVAATTENVDPNLQHDKPTERWRLNSNGYSQRYIELSSIGREDRMRELLSHYDKAPEYEVWKVVARIYRVYPEVLICIARADSSLGNELKTPHNIGNVGNNDRGDKVSYGTAEAGVNAIGKTLNNNNLSYIQTIDMLSRYKNATGMIYASSPENHFNNVANCIGMIRDKGVPDNFAFRW